MALPTKQDFINFLKTKVGPTLAQSPNQVIAQLVTPAARQIGRVAEQPYSELLATQFPEARPVIEKTVAAAAASPSPFGVTPTTMMNAQVPGAEPIARFEQQGPVQRALVQSTPAAQIPGMIQGGVQMAGRALGLQTTPADVATMLATYGAGKAIGSLMEPALTPKQAVAKQLAEPTQPNYLYGAAKTGKELSSIKGSSLTSDITQFTDKPIIVRTPSMVKGIIPESQMEISYDGGNHWLPAKLPPGFEGLVTEQKAIADILAQPEAKTNYGKIGNVPIGKQPGLTPKERAIESKSAAQLKSGPGAMLARYDSTNGNVINTDQARELFPDYSASHEARSLNARAVHEPASALIKYKYDKILADPQVQRVYFTAGGAGAGKTTGAASTFDKFDPTSALYDTNLANLPSAVQKIQQARAAGKTVDYNYVMADPMAAFDRMLQRAITKGRTVVIPEMVKTHVGALDTAKQIAAKFAGDPGVTFKYFDNTGPKGSVHEIPLDSIQSMSFDPQALKTAFTNRLQQLYDSGQIPKRVYDGVLGKGATPMTPPKATQFKIPKTDVNEMIKQINAGGTSYVPGEGFVKPGPTIMVGAYPTRRAAFPGEMSVNNLNTFIRNNADLLGQPHHAIGGWYDKDIGSAVMDISVPVPKSKMAEGLNLAKLQNQKAVFDMENFADIPTGGSGVGKAGLTEVQVLKYIQHLFGG